MSLYIKHQTNQTQHNSSGKQRKVHGSIVLPMVYYISFIITLVWFQSDQDSLLFLMRKKCFLFGLIWLSFISNSSPGAFYQQSVLCTDNWQLLLVFVSSHHQYYVVMELQGGILNNANLRLQQNRK